MTSVTYKDKDAYENAYKDIAKELGMCDLVMLKEVANNEEHKVNPH
jgi:hypothetical protein